MSESEAPAVVLNYAVVPKRKSFWDPFPEQRTRRQRVLDWVFGIVMPIVCVVADPIVFRGFGPILGQYRVVAYWTIGFELAALLLWLVGGHRSGPLRAVFGGALFVGSGLSLGIGLVLLPFSVIGLLAGIGVLGFTPLVTAYVFLGNAVQAIRQTRSRGAHAQIAPRAVVGAALAAGVLFTFGVIAPWRMDAVLRAIRQGDAPAVQVLKRWHWCVDMDRLVWAYSGETDAQGRARLAGAYREVTGEDIQQRLMMLDD